MPPGGHSAWSLAATFTPSPCRSVPSAITSPMLIPMRKRMRPIRRLVAIMDRHLLLHLHGTAHRPVDAVEHDQQRVAAGLDDPAAVLLDRRVDQVAPERAQPFERPGIVQPDQAAVADHVGIDDGDQLAAARGLAGEVRTDACRAHDRHDNTTATQRDHPGGEPGAECPSERVRAATPGPTLTSRRAASAARCSACSCRSFPVSANCCPADR